MNREIKNMKIRLSDDDLCQVNGGAGLETLPSAGEAVYPKTMERPDEVEKILQTMQGQGEPPAQGADTATQAEKKYPRI